MERKLDGIALISFAALLCCLSGKLSAFIALIGIGFAIPWALIALLLGIAGLILVFKDQESTKLIWLIIPTILAVYLLLIS